MHYQCVVCHFRCLWPKVKFCIQHHMSDSVKVVAGILVSFKLKSRDWYFLYFSSPESTSQSEQDGIQLWIMYPYSDFCVQNMYSFQNEVNTNYFLILIEPNYNVDFENTWHMYTCIWQAFSFWNVWHLSDLLPEPITDSANWIVFQPNIIIDAKLGKWSSLWSLY